MNIPIKIKKLSKDAVIPEYKHSADAGFDLSAAQSIGIYPGQTVKIHTGLAFEIPEGYEMQIRPRSGLSAKTAFRVIIGTIDSGYHGEVCVIAENKSHVLYECNGCVLGQNQTVQIYRGDRIAQAVIAPVVHATFEQVDELGDSERGAAGFGSTGVNG
ncbi:dUTP diphosphatase [Sporolactobacillus terrae]|uniref:dUTP diphosphatase n=1 Tax=Sporolactobacillus terrae TaxID=269673 RepID=UPI00048FAD48|nr:dUTP diphosphatase [Sporolactobacillus terrae]